MPNIRLLCVGKLKENTWSWHRTNMQSACPFCRLEIIEKRGCAPANPPQRWWKKPAPESEALLSAARGALVALSPEGERMTSPKFAALVRQYESELSFAIGGSYGLSPALKSRAVRVVSFSNLTMPHQLFRIVLLEQIFRAFMINSGRTYHK